MKEILVVLGNDTSGLALDDLRGRYPVQALMPPRIAILGSESDVSALHRLPQVEAILTGAADPLPASLSPPERVFVTAWQARQHAADKHRPGEGLAWDAEGFVPPDAPKK